MRRPRIVVTYGYDDSGTDIGVDDFDDGLRAAVGEIYPNAIVEIDQVDDYTTPVGCAMTSLSDAHASLRAYASFASGSPVGTSRSLSA